MEVISDREHSRSAQETNSNQWLFLLNVNHHFIQLTTFQSHLNDPKHFRNLQHTERGSLFLFRSLQGILRKRGLSYNHYGRSVISYKKSACLSETACCLINLTFCMKGLEFAHFNCLSKCCINILEYSL